MTPVPLSVPVSTVDLSSCLARIPDRRRAEGKMYSQAGVVLFSIIAMLSGALRSYRQVHAPVDRRLALLNAAYPAYALRRSPAHTSVRGIPKGIDPLGLEQAFRLHADSLDRSGDGAPSRFIAVDGKTLRQGFDAFADTKAAHVALGFRREPPDHPRPHGHRGSRAARKSRRPMIQRPGSPRPNLSRKCFPAGIASCCAS